MLLRILFAIVVAGGLMQLAPIGSGHASPAAVQEPAWDNPRTRELAKRACFNCHSNETVWPWYSRIAPVSWLVEHDVSHGRRHMNFSEWNKPHPNADEIVEQIESGGMPPWFYLPMHPEAKLTAEEKEALINGVERSLAASGK